MVASLLVLLGLLVIAAISVSAQADDEAPIMKGPEDKPGADVFWPVDVQYTLNATGSTDNKGIVKYAWNITYPDTTNTWVNTTTPTATWTPTQYGIYVIVLTGEDATGNRGYHLHTMDVYEVINGQNIRNTDVSYDHSVGVNQGTASFDNTNIEITGGLQGGAGGPSVEAPDTLAEALVNKKGDLAGYWQSYYAFSSTQYGDVEEDTNTVLSGDVSIKNTGGSYHYGFEYVFDDIVDLTVYTALTFYLHSDANSASNQFYYIYFYGVPGTYNTPYAYLYCGGMYTGGQSWYNDWHGYTIPLETEKVGYFYQYYMQDLSEVSHIRFYAYSNPNTADLWIDNVGFYSPEWGDNITESTSPSGDFSGQWSSTYGVSTTTDSFVGSAAVALKIKVTNPGTQNNIYYTFDTPQDLSGYNALRYISNLKTDTGSQCIYAYYWGYSNPLNVYDVNGNRAYDLGGNRYFYYGYGDTNGGPWFGNSWWWGEKAASYDNGVDWTQISRIRFACAPYYASPASSTGYYNYIIDGLEFYKPGDMGGGGPPVNDEDIAHGIYALDQGTLDMNKVTFSSTNKGGAFVRAESKMVIKNSTFDNLWATDHGSITTEGGSYGGIMAIDAEDVRLYDITITEAASSGIYIQNSNGDANNLDISGFGSDYMAAGMIIAFVDTDVGQASTMTIKNSKFHDGIMGSGILVTSFSASGTGKVVIDNCDFYRNPYSGAVTTISGFTGDITVDIMNSDAWSNLMGGFEFSVDKALNTPGTKVRYTVDGGEATRNEAYGIRFAAKNSVMKDIVATARNMDIHDNPLSGIYVSNQGTRGTTEVRFENVQSYENGDHGMEIYSAQPSTMRDILGRSGPADGLFYVVMEGCTFSANNGNGVLDVHNPAGSYQALAYENYRLLAMNTTVSNNEGHGWEVTPPATRPQYMLRYSLEEWRDCQFSDNKGDGIYIYHNYYAYYYYGAEDQEQFKFFNCTFNYNARGLREYFGQANYGQESWITLDGCTFEDNDDAAIHCSNAPYPSTGYPGGYSLSKTMSYDIRNTLLDGYVYLDLGGMYDAGGQYEISGSISIVNCTYTYDLPMYLSLASYYGNSGTFKGTVIYRDNTHTSPSIGDGIHIEMWAGTSVKAQIEISNIKLYDPLGHGINVLMGTMYTYTGYGAHRVTAEVIMKGVDIRNPIDDGVYVSTQFAMPEGAFVGGFYSLIDSNIQGANTGIKASGFSGEIRDSRFSNIRRETVYVYNGVVDIFESEVGPIEESNLRVDEKGAIRLWFKLRVKVVWRDEPDTPVVGTTVEIKDNSWTILGVNSIIDMDGVLFSNLNAYTMLAEGIFTKNPYVATADFIGIVKEQQVQISENTEITIKMVDDIQPRLTIESPSDGLEQREQSVVVKGTLYDKHTGADRVEVSIDGQKWFKATMSADKFMYEYTFEELPEGLTLIRVHGFDNAGNMKELATTVLVDSTPPDLEIYTPEDGMKTSKRYLEIVGITNVGANVYINDQPIETQYTLISHTMILAEGPNAIKVAAVDYLGNIAQDIRYVTLDTQAPYVDIINVEDGDSVSEEELTLIGLTEMEDVTVIVNDMPVEIFDGRFEATVFLVEGANNIIVNAMDGVDNERLLMMTVHLDKTAPWLRLVEPITEILTDNHFRVSGYVEQGSRVFVNDREIEVSFGYFETAVSAPDGAVDLEITAIDPAGNELVRIISLTVDTIAPAIMVTFPTENFVTNVETINVLGTILGTPNEDMRFLELYINGIPRLFDYTSGEFSHEVLLEEGVNRIAFESMDIAGNTERMVRTVMLDSQAPYLSVFVGNVREDPNWNEPVSLSDFVYVSGFTEIGVELTIDGVSVDVDGETGEFNYTLTIPKPLPDLSIFTKEIVVTSTDAAGNSVTIVEKANRLKGSAIAVEEETSTAEWLILFLAVVIFGMALAGAYGYNRIQSQQEMIEAYESAPSPAQITPEGKVITPPPARPARGGRARPRPATPKGEDEEVVIEMNDEEV